MAFLMVLPQNLSRELHQRFNSKLYNTFQREGAVSGNRVYVFVRPFILTVAQVAAVGIGLLVLRKLPSSPQVTCCKEKCTAFVPFCRS